MKITLRGYCCFARKMTLEAQIGAILSSLTLLTKSFTSSIFRIKTLIPMKIALFLSYFSIKFRVQKSVITHTQNRTEIKWNQHCEKSKNNWTPVTIPVTVCLWVSVFVCKRLCMHAVPFRFVSFLSFATFSRHCHCVVKRKTVHHSSIAMDMSFWV